MIAEKNQKVKFPAFTFHLSAVKKNTNINSTTLILKIYCHPFTSVICYPFALCVILLLWAS